MPLPLTGTTPCSLESPLYGGAARPVSTISTVILHHTAIESVGGSIATLRQRGLSYHYLVTPEGRVIAGVPLRRIALHAAGANRPSIGVSFVGGGTPEWVPTAPQLTAVRQLIGRLTRSLPGIRYLIGHGDVRDSNHGEPFGVDMATLLRDLLSQEKVRLRHPSPEHEPLRSYRRAALKLEARPLTPKHRISPAAVPAIETIRCAGEVIRYPVPDVFRAIRQ